jgi:5-formyltetrahydrofolate cyclo-ligase
VPDSKVFMMAHDSPLDFVATEKELIVTGNTAPRPRGVAWDFVQEDQFETIPFLRDLRDRMTAR